MSEFLSPAEVRDYLSFANPADRAPRFAELLPAKAVARRPGAPQSPAVGQKIPHLKREKAPPARRPAARDGSLGPLQDVRTLQLAPAVAPAFRLAARVALHFVE